MSVTITINGADAKEVLAELFGLAGGLGHAPTSTAVATWGAPPAQALSAGMTPDDARAQSAGMTPEDARTANQVEPAPTNAPTVEEKPKRTRGPNKPKDAPAASETPEIRANPEDRQDPAAVQEQDAADEAVETATEPTPEAPTVTREMARAVLDEWVQVAGPATVKAQGPKLLGHGKFSEVPDAEIPAAFEKLTQALAEAKAAADAF